MKLPRSFYIRSTLKITQELLGKFLVRKIGRKKIVGMIVETEAYVGFKDLASHASRGKTPRTAVMYGPAGHIYVYLVYGMYFCLNIVTERKGYPAAVLIRATEPVKSSRGRKASPPLLRTASGPGKVCQYFKIDKQLNGEDVCGRKLWIEDRGVKIAKKDIMKAKRVGVDYAGKYKNKLWRFYIKDNFFVSKK